MNKKILIVTMMLAAVCMLMLLLCGGKQTKKTVEITTQDEAAEVQTASENNAYKEPAQDDYYVEIKMEDVDKFAEVESADYYYSQLDNFDKKLYEAILNQMNHTNQMDYNTDILMDADLADKFKEDYLFVVSCVLDDHPEKFPYKKNYYEVKYEGEWLDDDSIIAHLYQRDEIEQYDEMMENLDNSVEAFLVDIDMSGTQYDVALQIHDKLIDLVEFEHDYVRIDEETAEEDVNINSHMRDVYGALVESSGGKNKAVCEGYADAYLYLLKKCNIKCASVSGYNGFGDVYEDAVENAKQESSRHAWVIANLDGKWYEIDPTFDDFELESVEQEIREYMIADGNYIYNREHMFWARTTHDMRYYTLEEGVTFGMDGERKKYPKDKYYYVYFRDNDDGVKQLYDNAFQNDRKADMLPIAE